MQAISRAVSFRRTQCKTLAFFRATVCVFLVAMLASPQLAGAAVVKTIVRMETNLGSFNIGLYDDDAVETVKNFLNYVNRGDYNNTIIHRGISGFIIQGGGYKCCNILRQLFPIPTDPAVPNEFDPSRSNIRGTIAMAKTSDPDSATSEWFINLDDNSAALDDTSNSGGFTVFGHVLDSGMDVVDKIAAVPTYPPPATCPPPPSTICAPIKLTFPLLSPPRTVQFLDFPLDNYNYDPVSPPPPQLSNFVPMNRVCINNDRDGVCSVTEDRAPNNGDGNGDGIQDRDQVNVTTIPTQFGTTATFEAEPTMRLDPIGAVSPSAATSLLTTFKSPPDQSAHFNNGMFNLTMSGNMGTTGHTLTVYDGASTRPTHYYAYGSTPDNPTDHWYDFAFDGVTGAEIKSDRIILHFVDGKHGDNDLDPNNDSISHVGAQAVLTPIASTSTGGGCSIAAAPSRTSRGGDWVLVSLFLAVLAIARKRAHRS